MEIEVTEKEKKLIARVRQLPYGKTYLVVINVKNQPVRIVIERETENVEL